MDGKMNVRELLFQCDQARKSRMHPLWTGMGLIAGQPRVLSKLLERDLVTQKELADACGIDPATLSRALDRLESIGLVCRQGHPSSRRAILIKLTQEGRVKAEAVAWQFQELEACMLDGLDEKETECFSRILEKICHNLRNPVFPPFNT